MVKNCDLGLENAALGLRPRAVFSRPRSQFFTIRTDQPANNIYSININWVHLLCLLGKNLFWIYHVTKWYSWKKWDQRRESPQSKNPNNQSFEVSRSRLSRLKFENIRHFKSEWYVKCMLSTAVAYSTFKENWSSDYIIMGHLHKLNNQFETVVIIPGNLHHSHWSWSSIIF